jgi:C4-dicarboxylate transporter, DctM subunit
LVTAAGFDKVWFGIFIVIVVEIAQITPPVAFNLSVIQSMTGQSMSYLTWVTMPYLIIMLLFVVLLYVFPGIALWLPKLLLG